MPLPQLKHDVYAKEVIALETSNFRLRQIIKDLEKSLKYRPDNSDLLMILGMALFRVGRQSDGINKMKYSLNLCPDKIGINNLVISLASNGEYDEAWGILVQHHMKISLFDAALCGKLDSLDVCLDRDMYSPLTEISRLILHKTPYASTYNINIDNDIDDGEVIVNITSEIPDSVESVFGMYCNLSKEMTKKFSSNVLTQIVPRFVSSL